MPPSVDDGRAGQDQVPDRRPRHHPWNPSNRENRWRKSLTAYASTSPRDSMDRQIEEMPSLSTSFVRPKLMQLPPIISIGGTSFDKYLPPWKHHKRSAPRRVSVCDHHASASAAPQRCWRCISEENREHGGACLHRARRTHRQHPHHDVEHEDRAVAEFVEWKSSATSSKPTKNSSRPPSTALTSSPTWKSSAPRLESDRGRQAGGAR